MPRRSNPVAITAPACPPTAAAGAYDKDATGFNSCQFGKLDDRWERYYAARPSQLFDRSECGKCIRARGTEKGASGDWVTVSGEGRNAGPAAQAASPGAIRAAWSDTAPPCSPPLPTAPANSPPCTHCTHPLLQVMIVDECASCGGDGEAACPSVGSRVGQGPLRCAQLAAVPASSWAGLTGTSPLKTDAERSASVPPWPAGDIDFSIDALKDITGFSWDRKGIEW